MSKLSLSSDPGLLRIIIFFGLLLLYGAIETFRPYRTFPYSRLLHWRTNLSLAVINNILIKLILPIGASGVALWAHNESLGLFPIFNMPKSIEIVIGVLLLDFVIWGQHVIFHKVPLLQRLHQVHHADLYFDVTTGIRFHPLEMVLSVVVKLSAILAFGLSVQTVVLFEILLNATAMFNHSNFSLPARLDRLIRLVLVTPDMHRVHHSVIKKESNSNYGFSIPWWDYLFGTYCRETANPNGLEIGLKLYPLEQTTFSIIRILKMPFQTK